jgi:hypothetical protein
MMTHERRRHRSAVRSEALVLLLEACRERTGLEALVISDRDGLLVSSSARQGIDPEGIAAHLPSTELRERVPSLRAFTFKLSGMRLFLGAVGAMSEQFITDICDAMRGTQRILAGR